MHAMRMRIYVDKAAGAIIFLFSIMIALVVNLCMLVVLAKIPKACEQIYYTLELHVRLQ